MPCYFPLQAWRTGRLGSADRAIVFKRPKVESADMFPLKLPCGQCVGCRLERSRQWAVRCMHEASLYERNCFITLTYDDAHSPDDGGLVQADFQKFMKRLRKDANRSGIRYFHCGEYGDRYGRPHYHACLFDYDFDDKVHFRTTPRGDVLYRSPVLERLWPYGHSMIGSVTFESAAYVARYVMKKVTGKAADEHYVDKSTGVLREPEYVTMSRGSKSIGTGGIGKGWFQKYKLDINPRDYAVVRGVKQRPPRYYDGLYELEAPDEYARLKSARVARAHRIDPDGSGEFSDTRLAVKCRVKQAQLRSLSRSLEV